jgi:hypothetical protein
VLRPGGVAFLVIHPITAMSGGHHPGTFCHDGDPAWTPKIPPWDHLRGDRHPSGVFLNRLRPAEYRAIFEERLETVFWRPLGPEGERFLTPEIESELSDYSREELLTGKILYLGRRR